MAVTVNLPTIMRSFAGGDAKVDATGSTVRDVFTDLDSRFPGIGAQLLDEDGGLRRFVNVYLDDEDIRYLEALDTTVGDGAEISILPAVAGGCRVGEGP